MGNDKSDLKSWEKPNAFVICGPKKTPFLVAFDENGRVTNRGAEVAEAAVIFPNGISPDVLVLVHLVEGDGTMLIKKLEVNKLMNNSAPVSAQELVEMDMLKSIAMKLRETYMQKTVQRKQGKTVKDTMVRCVPAKPKTG